MTRINKAKDGIIGPEPVVGPKPIPTRKTKKLSMRMSRAELADEALRRQKDVEGKTKKQLLEELVEAPN